MDFWVFAYSNTQIRSTRLIVQLAGMVVVVGEEKPELDELQSRGAAIYDRMRVDIIFY